jgi:hypothetical protein
MRRVEPNAGDRHLAMAACELRVVAVAAEHEIHWYQASVDQKHRGRLVLREPEGLVQQGFVGHHLPTSTASIGADDDRRLCIVDALRKARAAESAENHAVDGPDTRASEHREYRFRNHWHVEQDAIALTDPQLKQNRGHTLHFVAQFAVSEATLIALLAGGVDQRGLLGSIHKMTIYRVVAQISVAANEPLGEGRVGVVAHADERTVPVHKGRLLRPELVSLFQ